MTSLEASITSNWLDLLWRSWRSLGVRASHMPVVETMLDPEALIIATGALTAGGNEPRVYSHALYWCMTNHRLVATTRLKRLLRSMPVELAEPFMGFAGTVNASAPTRWPTDGAPAAAFPLRETPQLPPGAAAPALLRLRLRLLMGANARSEVMSICLANPDVEFELRVLERHASYARRHLVEPVADLARGGWLEHSQLANRHRYRCAATARDAFAGAKWVDWPQRFELLTVLLRVARHLDAGHLVQALVELLRHGAMFRDHARLEVPPPLRLDESIESREPLLRQWVQDAARELLDVA